ncbi:MAG TPA: hypothetical protein VFO85_18155, partial [Vicinamibacteria bacterium]|nr:hypothetical protein [Vicinamibacteria bacterium]
DRVFSWFVRGLSAGRLASAARALVVPRVLPRLLRSSWLRATAFRFASELRIHYRQSAAVTEGAPRPRRGPRAGDRLPDARVSLDGHPTWLQRAVIGPHLSLLLCGDPDGWDAVRLAALAQRRPGLLCIHRLARAPGPGVLVDGGAALDLLGAGAAAQYLVRPDGYVAFRCGGYDLDAVTRYLGDWF